LRVASAFWPQVLKSYFKETLPVLCNIATFTDIDVRTRPLLARFGPSQVPTNQAQEKCCYNKQSHSLQRKSTRSSEMQKSVFKYLYYWLCDMLTLHWLHRNALIFPLSTWNLSSLEEVRTLTKKRPFRHEMLKCSRRQYLRTGIYFIALGTKLLENNVFSCGDYNKICYYGPLWNILFWFLTVQSNVCFAWNVLQTSPIFYNKKRWGIMQ
jgi:hypothetical protein